MSIQGCVLGANDDINRWDLFASAEPLSRFKRLSIQHVLVIACLDQLHAEA
jgi:hypothetical protein